MESQWVEVIPSINRGL